MKNYKLNTNSNFDEKDINLTIGNFDGVHLGHQHIINHLIKISKLMYLSIESLTTNLL